MIVPMGPLVLRRGVILSAHELASDDWAYDLETLSELVSRLQE